MSTVLFPHRQQPSVFIGGGRELNTQVKNGKRQTVNANISSYFLNNSFPHLPSWPTSVVRPQFIVLCPASDSINLSSASPTHKGEWRRAAVGIYRRHSGSWHMWAYAPVVITCMAGEEEGGKKNKMMPVTKVWLCERDGDGVWWIINEQQQQQ